jgi:N-acyl homoserine lactone hydrolase
MGTTNSVARVSAVSTGQVDIHPQHIKSSGTPVLWWVITSRRWTGYRPINARLHAATTRIQATGR